MARSASRAGTLVAQLVGLVPGLQLYLGRMTGEVTLMTRGLASAHSKEHGFFRGGGKCRSGRGIWGMGLIPAVWD